MGFKAKRSGLSFMISESLKEQFYKACERNGSHASEEIRAFIKRSIAAEKNTNYLEEKNTQVVVRMDADMRINFVEYCNSRDLTASYSIRNFIKQYLKRNT